MIFFQIYKKKNTPSLTPPHTQTQ